MAFRQYAIGVGMAALATTACVGTLAESRVRAGLAESGLPDAMAACMAKPMATELSIGQLRKLQSLGAVRNSQNRRLTLPEFLHKVRALHDPEIIAVTGRAALSCAF
jgi:hypothetical protein